MICAALFTFSHGALTQEEYGSRRTSSAPPDGRHRNTASIAFDKSFNTYHWIGTTFYENTFGPLSLELHEQFISSLIRTDRNLISDNQYFDLRLRHRWTDAVRFSTRVSSFILSDDKGIGITNASSHAFYGGVAYQPIRAFMIEPLVGVRWDHQIDRHDKGLSYLLGLSSEILDLDGYTSQLKGTFQYDRLDPRTLETYLASLSIEKIFFEQTRNLVQFQYSRNRRDFYFLATPTIQQQYGVTYNIESRADNSFSVIDTLDYNISRNLLATFGGMVFTRQINRMTRYKNFTDPLNSPLNTSIDELRIEGSARTRYAISNRFTTTLTFSYLEREENHQLQPEETFSQFDLVPLSHAEERKNNHSRRTSLTVETNVLFSPSDTVVLSGSSNLLRYDTPTKENDDDRDELWHILNFSTRHRINQYLYATIAADVSLTHLVYIFSSRSADNTWNRIFRIGPRILYIPTKEISTTNIFEVLANYTVYDFESGSSTTRSFVFRQFAFTDSTTISLTKRLSVDLFSNIRLYERGELLWDAFSERPLNYFEDKTYIASFRYALTERLLFSLGIRYFSQLRYGYVGQERVPETFLRSRGPMASMMLNVGGRTDLLIRGWYERQSQTGQPDHGFTTMVMSMDIRL
ncbi:MAG: hypothetical protein HYR76_01980 [Ignavibacteria bacterium]|nr:hypothetical protein [Ignavibacteria bacterium]